MLLRIAQPIILSVAVLAIIILPHSSPIQTSETLEKELVTQNSLHVLINQNFTRQTIKQAIHHQYNDQQVLEIITEEFSLRFIIDENRLQNGLYSFEEFNGNIATIHFKDGCYATTDHYFTAILNIQEINTNEIKGSFNLMANAETCNQYISLQNGEFRTSFEQVLN